MDDPNQVPSPPSESMPMYEKALAEARLGQIGSLVEHRPTISEQLAMRKKHLEAELVQVNAAIEAALENTGTMRVLDAITKAGLIR